MIGPEKLVTNSDPKYYIGPRPKFENGGIMKCLKGGKPYSECMKCGGKTLKAEDGEKVLPQFAKIIEGGGANAEPRRIYYSESRNNFTPRDGMVMSHEEVVNPWGYWNNEIIKAGSQFGINLPQVPVMYAQPTYSRFVQHPDGMNLQPATDIDANKAAHETSEKIKKIRGEKKQMGGNLPKKKTNRFKK